MRDQLTVALSRPAIGVTVLRMGGELDLLTVPRARRVLLDALDAVVGEPARGEHSGGRMLCDLEALDFLSATALGMLVEVDEYARTRGGALVLVAGTGPVARVLALTGLDDHFVTTPSVDRVVVEKTVTGLAS